MKVVLSRSLHIGKHYYPAGEQEIKDDVLRSKEFAKHIKAGHIMEPSQAPKKVVVKSAAERAAGLLEKIGLKPEHKDQGAAAEKADEKAPEAVEAAPADEVESKSGKSGKKK